MRGILLIDDNPYQIGPRENALHDAGFVVHVATSAGSGMTLARNKALGSGIGAVVMDHGVPGITSDFVRKLRHERPDVLLVVLSGVPGAKNEYAGSDVEFHPKPCPPEKLADIVRRRLRQKAA